MPVNVETTPPPRIGKIGPYTVFITPPSTPSTPKSPSPRPHSDSPKKTIPAASPLASPPPPPVHTHPPPPPAVQAPPSQFYGSTKPSQKSHLNFGFFWDAVAKVQNAHASLDGHVAYWFGLNQSKYQWALDDYYESKGINPVDAKSKGLSDKVQNV